MWDYCGHSLDIARLRGATYADVRVMHLRQRDLTTKSGEVGTLGQANPSASAFASLSTALGVSLPPTNLPVRASPHAPRKPSPSPRRPPSRKKKMCSLQPNLPMWTVGRVLARKIHSKFPSKPDRSPAKSRCRDEPDQRRHTNRNRHAIPQDRFLVRFQRRIENSSAPLPLWLWNRRHLLQGDAIQKRSYPNSFGGQHILGGYELIEAMNLLKHAPQMAEEAVALHSSAQCPEKNPR